MTTILSRRIAWMFSFMCCGALVAGVAGCGKGTDTSNPNPPDVATEDTANQGVTVP